jgi:hypothetical protein
MPTVIMVEEHNSILDIKFAAVHYVNPTLNKNVWHCASAAEMTLVLKSIPFRS